MKITQYKSDDLDRAPLAWMSLTAAAYWVAHGIEASAPSDDCPIWPDDQPIIRDLWDLRKELAAGKVEAFGFRGDPETSPPLPILAAAWSQRRLGWGWDQHFYEPYSLIVVDRAAIMALWPPCGMAAPAIGRPPEYDWERVRKMASEEAPGMGRAKLADVLRARYEAEIGIPAPSPTSMKTKLREWEKR